MTNKVFCAFSGIVMSAKAARKILPLFVVPTPAASTTAWLKPQRFMSWKPMDAQIAESKSSKSKTMIVVT